MKKLMITLGVIAVAVASNAANIKWGSSTMYLPDANGSFQGVTYDQSTGKYSFSSTAKIGTTYTVKSYAWESLTASAVAYTAGDLYKWYTGTKTTDPFGTSLTAVEGTYNNSMSVANITGALVADPKSSESVTAAILYVLEDDKGKAKWYMENTATKAGAQSMATQSYMAEFKNGNNATPQSGNLMSWTAVSTPTPEPTSAMLLLLGVAGLALKRKQK